MRFLSAAHTDVGIRKKTNQDSLCLMAAQTKYGEVCLAVICDGMGGLQKGELASATVIKSFSRWFKNELPQLLRVQGFSLETIRSSWDKMINEQNSLVYRFGINENIQLGTTLTAMFFINDKFITAQLGDSRAYSLDTKINQLTRDQSVVARDVENGVITAEQAKTDPRRNVLLQCLGATQAIKTEYTVGNLRPNMTFLLCSDGFVHEVFEEEMFGLLAPGSIRNEGDMKHALTGLVELNKNRGETDNITALLVKSVQ